jgi:hypothetical protein
MDDGPEKEQKRPVDDKSTDPAAQRPRREWLAAPQGGRRQPRIGNDFQVSALPTPQSSSEEQKEDTKEGEEANTEKEATEENDATTDESGEMVKESEVSPREENK